ncbi:MAG: DUF1669 domain-containing protein [Bdellovibrionales bacterium]|nr:DUF1669 domain-containing protein [Bdellovibrionales bacterium]
MLHLFLKNINIKSTLKSFYFLSIFVLFLNTGSALEPVKTQAWFHPNDPSLYEIAKILSQAKSSIDIAMYNMTVSESNPIVESLLKKDIQKRIYNSELKIRIIFQGYGSKESKFLKLQKLEDMGIDVKYFSKSKKLHHKFAVIDGNTVDAKLITGSANWSLSSYNNYNDNILYFANSPLLSKSYQREFNFLWEKSTEFGNQKIYKSYHNLSTQTPEQTPEQTSVQTSVQTVTENGVKTYFNSKILSKPSKNKKNINAADYILTNKIVEKINQAKNTINIATTRIKLFPIYSALLKAAKRGVNINIIVTMAQYETFYKRKKNNLTICKYEFSPKCSIGIKYSTLLEKDSLTYKNIAVRIKYFDFRPDQSIQKQMHHKYIIIDNKYVLTGSFNWSFSSEFQHIENLLFIDAHYYPNMINQFKKDFASLWINNRDKFDSLYNNLKENFKQSIKFKCAIDPISLSYSQIDKIRKLILEYKRKTKTRRLNLCL